MHTDCQISSGQKIYPSANRQFHLLVGWLSVPVILVGISAMLFTFQSYLLIILFSFPTSFIAWISLYQARRIRLTVSSDEIIYQGVGYNIRSRWDNVARIGPDPIFETLRTKGKVSSSIVSEGLILRHSGLWKQEWFALQKTGVRRDCFIPLSLFGGNQWRDGQLGQDIKQFAPHLFLEEQKAG